ncbi:MAG TPA: SoxR reducing system RseC family protein [Spirochaetia bacterium]|nr:SoxR reducing system RseC family protein [Spirochaetia bacterium]
MQESATVLSCADGIALVRIERSAACDGCDLCTFSESAHAMTARAIDRLGVSPGDRVMIETRAASPVAASLLLFLVPLAFLFCGYGAGALLAPALGVPTATQPAGAASAVIFFLASFGFLALLTRKRHGGRGAEGVPAVIVEKLTESADERRAQPPSADESR